MSWRAISDPIFRETVEAIDNGDITVLQHLLETHPDLGTRRLDLPDQGYFAHPYLLWFVADNPIRNGKLPSNIVEIAQLIIKATPNLQQHQLDYTLGLVATGRIPKECGVQIDLMNSLIQAGAQVKGSVLGPIGQHNLEAAQFLLDKGADYDLPTAVGLDHKNNLQSLIASASTEQLYVALVVASFFGKVDIITLLLNSSADPNGSASPEAFGGFHSHATPLHQAVSSGSAESVRLLVNAGADLNAVDKIYNGTPLGWAIHMKSDGSIRQLL